MKKEVVEKVINRLDCVSNTTELMREITPLLDIFERRYDRNEEQRKVILKKIAEVASNFGESFEHSYEGAQGEEYILGISFNREEKPKVYSGYRWHEENEKKGYPAMESYEYLHIRELNMDDEDIERVSIMPSSLNINTTSRINKRINSINEILYSGLKAQYHKKKSDQKVKVKL